MYIISSSQKEEKKGQGKKGKWKYERAPAPLRTAATLYELFSCSTRSFDLRREKGHKRKEK